MNMSKIIYAVLFIIGSIHAIVSSDAAEYVEHEKNPLLKTTSVRHVGNSLADKKKEFNNLYGDGFGDYVLSNLSSNSVNVLRVKEDLKPFCMSSGFFISYCAQHYRVSAECSERMRQTLLEEMGLKQTSSHRTLSAATYEEGKDPLGGEQLLPAMKPVLQHNPEFVDFSERVTPEEEVLSYDTPAECQYALVRLRANHQVTLNASDIISRTINAGNPQKVCYINFGNVDFRAGGRQGIFDYFAQNTLANLRYMDLCQSKNVSDFIEELFGHDKPKNKFPSLFRIGVSNSDFKSQDLIKIFQYFSDSRSYFIRDMKQFSAGYDDVAAAPLLIEAKGVKWEGGFESINSWRIGKKTAANYAIFYRSKENPIKGPLIMNVDG